MAVRWRQPALKVLALAACLYLFLAGIKAMGHGLALLGGDFSDRLIHATSSPLIGLFIGILATAIVQSSSSTTSIVTVMVGTGTLTLEGAIPIIMGANLGTTITATLVSLAHLPRRAEFRRAFAAACLHDWFNLLAVALLFPLEMATGWIAKLSSSLAATVASLGGLQLADPVKTLAQPVVTALGAATGQQPVLILLLSIALIAATLWLLVKLLRALMEDRLKKVLADTLFRNAGWALAAGLGLTLLVQSSSVTISLMIPLAGMGAVTLAQVFPYILGANLGTTGTATLAALALGAPAAIAVALAHLLFNLAAALLIWPVPRIRQIPLHLADGLANLSFKNRALPIGIILVVFYIIPALATWNAIAEVLGK